MGVFDRIADFIRGPRPEAYPAHVRPESAPALPDVAVVRAIASVEAVGVRPWDDLHRDPYVPTPEEEVEIEAWEQAQRDGDNGPVPERYGVEAVHTSDWYTYAPGEEAREHIGRSPEGWHYAVETSRFGGDDHPNGPSWSFAYPTREHAEASMQTAALHLDLDRDDEGHEP